MDTPFSLRILALHGFTGRGGDFDPLREFLAKTGPEDCVWHCPDLPGHGPKSSLDCAPEAIIELVEVERSTLNVQRPTSNPKCSTFNVQSSKFNVQRQTFNVQRQTFNDRRQIPNVRSSTFNVQSSTFNILLGYSMGARAALLHAVPNPGAWDALVLVSANPGIADPAERAARRESDEALADRIEREGVPAFLDWWQEQPLIRSQRAIPDAVRARMRVGRLEHRPEGLAASLRQFGQGNCPDLWPDLHRLAMPVLLVCGEEDARYRAIAERMRALLPDATSAVVPGTGHAPHLEQPAEAAKAMAGFLAPA